MKIDLNYFDGFYCLLRIKGKRFLQNLPEGSELDARILEKEKPGWALDNNLQRFLFRGRTL